MPDVRCIGATTRERCGRFRHIQKASGSTARTPRRRGATRPHGSPEGGLEQAKLLMPRGLFSARKMRRVWDRAKAVEIANTKKKAVQRQTHERRRAEALALQEHEQQQRREREAAEQTERQRRGDHRVREAIHGRRGRGDDRSTARSGLERTAARGLAGGNQRTLSKAS